MKMSINPGEIFNIELNGQVIPVQAILSVDDGVTWTCCRTDRSLSETAIVLSADELLQGHPAIKG